MERIQKNSQLTVDIIDYNSDGAGVGKTADGAVVFVSGAAVGDNVTVLVIKSSKNYCVGKIVSVNKHSQYRIEPDCTSFPRCGGCSFRHISYESECEHKYSLVKNALSRIGGIDITPCDIVPADEINGWRNKAQYPVQYSANERAISGFYARFSHRIIESSSCCLEPQKFSLILNKVLEFINQNKISVYDERSGKGLVRHIYLRCAHSTGEIMVCIVINGEKLPHSDRLVTVLTEYEPQIKSIVLNINREKSNVITGHKCISLYGDGYIRDVFADLNIILSPLSFYQVNSPMAEKLYEKAAEYARPEGKRILDIYCGIGLIGLSMAKKAKSIVGVEVVPDAVSDAQKIISQNGINNSEIFCSDAAEIRECILQYDHFDTVIVDPPRKGCDRDLLSIIYESLKPESIVYISCDPATLARDAAILAENGYKMQKATPYDLFPRTTHVETVVLMSKVR